MMDRGIDYRHPDFIDRNGNTRISYIFDMYDDSGANDPDNPYGVGTIYDSAEINSVLQHCRCFVDREWDNNKTEPRQ